jgi:hypothetical protein
MKAVRVLLALLASAAVVLGLAPVPVAHASEPAALVRITLTGMTPALPQRDGQVTLRGQVQNVTKQRLYRLQAIFWRNQAPITNGEGVQQALDSESNVPLGARKTAVYQDLYTATHPYLEPGARSSFTLTAPVADLQLSPTDGVYLMGVHVLQDGNPVAVGRARTFVPVLDSPPKGRLQMTSLVVLSSRPSQLRRGVLADDHLAEEVQPGGRLTQLLQAADRNDVSFAVDPALVDELTTMRSGYTVASGDGSTTAGHGQSAATAWLERFETVAGSRDGFQLLYGSPDIAALVHNRQTSVLAEAVTAGKRVSATARLPLLVLPGGGYADTATLAAAEQLAPSAVVLSNASAIADAPLLAGPGTAPVVRYGSDALGGGPGPDPRNTAVQLRQRTLADSWVEASAASEGVTRGQVRLVTDTNQLQDDDAGVEAPWMTRTTLGALLRGTPELWDRKLAYPPEAVAAELTRDQLARLRSFTRSTKAYREVLVHPDLGAVAGPGAVVRAASVAWRGQDVLWSAFLEPQQEGVNSVLNDQLRISTNPKVSTVAREGVEFPITIQNLLPADETDGDVNAVKLRLVFVSANRQRLTIKPIEAPLIRAGQNFTANARVTAKANGTVPVRAQLQTASGTPVGRPQTIDVRVTQNGTTGWAIAAAALVLFGGGTALRIRQVGRTPAAAVSLPEPAPSALTSALPAEAPATSRPTATPDTRDA